jgi:hypothetical protein
MKILLKPSFMYEVNNFEGHVGLTSMTEENQDKLNVEIISYLRELFPEPERSIKRVKKTNYYSVDILNDEIDNIQTWYNTHLADAVARGFDSEPEWMIYLNENVDYAPDDQPFAAEELNFSTQINELPDYFNFDTEEDRRDVMGYVNLNDDLYKINLPNLFAKKTNFTALLFTGSKLNKSIFTEAILPMTKFNQCELKEANFQNADLRYAEFQGANLEGANFSNANLEGADFVGSNWQDAINIRDNPTFTAPEPGAVAPAPIRETQDISTTASNVAIPSVLKKIVKTQQRGRMLKDDVYQSPDEKNVVDAENPKKFKHCNEPWTSRPRLIVTKSEYEMIQAKFADVDPTFVSIENEETDKGKKLGEDLLLEEDESLKNFFDEQPDGFLFRVVQGDKFDDILLSDEIYQPSTSDYLRDEKDLILYMCRPGSMGSANQNRPLIDIGKAIGMSTARIYVDFSEFGKIVLADRRKYKCYILYNDSRESEKYQALTSHNVLFNPGMNIVGQLHCNEGEGMSGVIWSIKPIGDNLMQTADGGKRLKQKNTRKKIIRKTRKNRKPSTIKKRQSKKIKRHTKKYKRYTKK